MSLMRYEWAHSYALEVEKSPFVPKFQVEVDVPHRTIYTRLDKLVADGLYNFAAESFETL